MPKAEQDAYDRRPLHERIEERVSTEPDRAHHSSAGDEHTHDRCIARAAFAEQRGGALRRASRRCLEASEIC